VIIIEQLQRLFFMESDHVPPAAQEKLAKQLLKALESHYSGHKGRFRTNLGKVIRQFFFRSHEKCADNRDGYGRDVAPPARPRGPRTEAVIKEATHKCGECLSLVAHEYPDGYRTWLEYCKRDDTIEVLAARLGLSSSMAEDRVKHTRKLIVEKLQSALFMDSYPESPDIRKALAEQVLSVIEPDPESYQVD
jgi:hypothetical protein